MSPSLTDRFLAAYARRRWRGFLTLCRWLGRPVIEVRTSHGGLMTLYPEEHIDRIVLQDGCYEPEVLAALRPLFFPGAVVWDIGANFGLHSITAAVTAPGLKIHSFEPNPAVFARLETHVKRNAPLVRCWPVALGDRDGTGTLHVHGDGNPAMTTLIPWAEATYATQVEVSLFRADTLIKMDYAPAPHLVKLDVKGSEAAVLTGFGEWLHHPQLRAVIFESRADLLSNLAQCPAARLLQAAGFGFTALPRAAGHAPTVGNFLAHRPA